MKRKFILLALSTIIIISGGYLVISFLSTASPLDDANQKYDQLAVNLVRRDAQTYEVMVQAPKPISAFDVRFEVDNKDLIFVPAAVYDKKVANEYETASKLWVAYANYQNRDLINPAIDLNYNMMIGTLHVPTNAIADINVKVVKAESSVFFDLEEVPLTDFNKLVATTNVQFVTDNVCPGGSRAACNDACVVSCYLRDDRGACVQDCSNACNFDCGYEMGDATPFVSDCSATCTTRCLALAENQSDPETWKKGCNAACANNICTGENNSIATAFVRAATDADDKSSAPAAKPTYTKDPAPKPTPTPTAPAPSPAPAPSISDHVRSNPPAVVVQPTPAPKPTPTPTAPAPAALQQLQAVPADTGKVATAADNRNAMSYQVANNHNDNNNSGGGNTPPAATSVQANNYGGYTTPTVSYEAAKEMRTLEGVPASALPNGVAVVKLENVQQIAAAREALVQQGVLTSMIDASKPFACGVAGVVKYSVGLFSALPLSSASCNAIANALNIDINEDVKLNNRDAAALEICAKVFSSDSKGYPGLTSATSAALCETTVQNFVNSGTARFPVVEEVCSNAKPACGANQELVHVNPQPGVNLVGNGKYTRNVTCTCIDKQSTQDDPSKLQTVNVCGKTLPKDSGLYDTRCIGKANGAVIGQCTLYGNVYKAETCVLNGAGCIVRAETASCG